MFRLRGRLSFHSAAPSNTRNSTHSTTSSLSCRSSQLSTSSSSLQSSITRHSSSSTTSSTQSSSCSSNISKKQSPQHKHRNGDKLEQSPTSNERCQKCRLRIKKGGICVGIEEYSPTYGSYIHRYYHGECFTGNWSKLKLNKNGPPLDDKMKKYHNEKIEFQIKKRIRNNSV